MLKSRFSLVLHAYMCVIILQNVCVVDNYDNFNRVLIIQNYILTFKIMFRIKNYV